MLEGGLQRRSLSSTSQCCSVYIPWYSRSTPLPMGKKQARRGTSANAWPTAFLDGVNNPFHVTKVPVSRTAGLGGLNAPPG